MKQFWQMTFYYDCFYQKGIQTEFHLQKYLQFIIIQLFLFSIIYQRSMFCHYFLLSSIVLTPMLAIFQMSTSVTGWPFTGSISQFFQNKDVLAGIITSSTGDASLQKVNVQTSMQSTIKLPNLSTNDEYYVSYDDFYPTLSIRTGNTIERSFMDCTLTTVVLDTFTDFCFGNDPRILYFSVINGTEFRIFSYAINTFVKTELFLGTLRSYIGIKCIDDTQMYVISKDGSNIYVNHIYFYSNNVQYSAPLALATTELNENMVIFNNDTQIIIIRVSDHSVLSLPHANKIQKVIPISTSFVVIHNTDNTLDLYDINRQSYLDKMTESQLTSFACYEGDKSVLIMVDQKSHLIRKIKISSHYVCASCTCDPGYTKILSICYQDTFVATPNTQFQSPSLTVTSNAIDCLPGLINQTNITFEGSAQFSPQQLPSQTVDSSQQQIVEPWVAQVGKILGITLSIAYFPTFLKFLIPFLLFVEDIWLYKFHVSVEYTNFMRICMQESQIIKIFQVFPHFQGFDFNLPVSQQDAYYNTRYVSRIQKEEKNERGVNDQQIYWPIIINIFIYPNIPLKLLVFVVLNICHQLLSRCFPDHNSFMHQLAVSLKRRSRLWFFWTLVLDPFLVKMSFSLFNQISLLNAEIMINKLYLSLACVSAFLLVQYAIAFYVMIYKTYKLSSQNLLTFTQFGLKSFWLETILIPASKISQSFMHSNLLPTHLLKIQGLLILDLLKLAAIFVFRKQFHNKATFLAYTLYALTFMSLNICLLIKELVPTLWNSQVSDQIFFYTLLILIGLSILKILLSVYQELKNIIVYCINRKTRVSDISSINHSKKANQTDTIRQKRLFSSKQVKKSYFAHEDPKRRDEEQGEEIKRQQRKKKHQEAKQRTNKGQSEEIVKQQRRKQRKKKHEEVGNAQEHKTNQNHQREPIFLKIKFIDAEQEPDAYIRKKEKKQKLSKQKIKEKEKHKNNIKKERKINDQLKIKKEKPAKNKK